MLFNSIQFLIFFPLVVAIFFALPHRFRWLLLLVASYYFYAVWKFQYLFLIWFSTGIDFFASQKMAQFSDKAQRKKYLLLSLITNLGLLFSFKYLGLFNESIRAIFTTFGLTYNVSPLNIIVPVGISFYTFQTLSYTIEVYRGNILPEKNFGLFALYVAFFPQLVAGPIERPDHLLPQFRQKFNFDYQRVMDGLSLMLWGMFKKVVIADRLAIFVDLVYSNPTNYTGLMVLVATYAFAIQIFCDFSGYSDIAIGAARVMGYHLNLNFDRPYMAQSIREFWQRWHISLSTWFRDYLYIPLGGNRVGKWRWQLNLFLVFLISGLWHGANWTFAIWGMLHGLYFLVGIGTADFRANFMSKLNRWPKTQQSIAIFTTFHLVTFAWIFFRANTVSDAFLLIRNMVRLTTAEIIATCLIFLLIFMLGRLVSTQESLQTLRVKLRAYPRWLRWTAYASLILLMMNFGVAQEVPFIYFQF